MRTRAGWGVVVAVMATAAGGGCGQEREEAPPPEVSVVDTDGEQPPVAEAPDTQEPPPPNTPAPDMGWWHISPEAGPITFEAPACIQVDVATAPRFDHPCSVKHFRKDGSLARLQRFDAENRRLEDSTFAGEGMSPLRQLWSYDEAGRLVLSRIIHSPEFGYVTRYSYDTQGRLEGFEDFFVVTKAGGETRESPNLQYRYLHDEAGRLEATEYSSDGTWYAYEKFLYHPNGQLRRRSEVYDSSALTSWDYDEQGRLVRFQVGDRPFDEGRRYTTYSYDARGLRVEEYRRHDDFAGFSEGFTRYLYDEGGRLGAEQFIEDGAYTRTSQPSYIRERAVKRYFHSCGGELLFEEQDTNEDGVRDGWRELVRDAAGNLRVERLHGTRVDSWVKATRVEYEYDCHP
jgi:hypothetical protein